MTRLTLLVSILLVLSPVTFGVIETYDFSAPALEDRYRLLSQELRCPKCQNQNIADSNAPISRDLRAIVHEQLEAGASDDEIVSYLVDRYGEFVRYRPGVDKNTVWLWSAPFLLFVMAATVVLVRIRKDRGAATLNANADRASDLRSKFSDSDHE